jgi:N-acetylmuramoyl-L-alanine amidase
MRKRILKGVLRENLVILGVEKRGRFKRRFAVRPSLAFALVLAGALLVNSGRVTTLARTSSEGTGRPAVAQAPPPTAMAAGYGWRDGQAGDRIGPPAPPFMPPSDYDGMAAAGTVKDVFGLGVRTIMIDPGHGGEDTGAIGRGGTEEKEITLDIALKLRDMLRRNTPYKIILSRETDANLPLKDRVALANSQRVDLFVSIHVNSLPSKPLDIIETYYFGPSKDKAMLALAAAENEGSNYNISDYQEVIKEIGNQLKYQESRDMAGRIQSNLFQSMKQRNKNVLDYGVKRAPFMVLLGVDMPGVLVEVACLSNREEEIRLRDPLYRESIAGYLERGIISYLNDRSSS